MERFDKIKDMLTGHGDDWFNFNKPMLANFSSNVWYGIDHNLLFEHLTKQITSIEQYPHPFGEPLRETLAWRNDTSKQNIVVTNGAIEAIYLIAQLMQNKKTAIAIPSFSEYEDACQIFGHNCTYFTIDKLEEISNQNFETIWLCNPNNPDGRVISREQLIKLIEATPETYWIIDEAYQEFLQEPQSVVSILDCARNLFIIKSLTKRFCMPSLRLGYILTDRENVNALLRIKQPWSVNSLAIAAGQYFCQNEHLFPLPIEKWMGETKTFQSFLQETNYFDIIESKTPYFLLNLKTDTASALKQYLANKHQILIRDASTFRGLSKKHIRLCTQNQSSNKLLINALKDWINIAE